ncbi:UDP-N-acetylglucosamine 2-epimerase (non-hydrolyzing) [Luteimonas sp. MC1782]|nr:UDP-N-acetylglucosamine 2-epimerase (non-hydrolyzing) [Luteimonas sp. MC1782]
MISRISIVAGARPNFVKIAPILRNLERERTVGSSGIRCRLIHTGQHYDHGMSQSFFDDLGIRAPDANLNCGSGTQAETTAAIMVAFERELTTHLADLVLVVGDVNSTLACSIVAKKMGCLLAHVEAGIRSGDMSMPEEINRIVTDSLSDIFYTPSIRANQNLQRAGVAEKSIVFVGNVMIDSLVGNLERLQRPTIWEEAGLASGQYIVLTMHRPATVDNSNQVQGLLEVICRHTDLPIVFPVHPRTRDKVEGVAHRYPNLLLVPPMGYLEFIYLVRRAKGVISDSGGISEETTYLGVPCITLRDNTERPETITQGTNRLVGHDHGRLRKAMADLMAGKWQHGQIPEKWDGRTAERIAAHLEGLASA